MYCTGFIHFANRYACVTFWTHSWPTTGNSKPNSPYQIACVRSVTSRFRSVRLCTASASWCWLSGWNVRQKLNLCSTPWSHKSHMITLFTAHDFIFFHWSMMSLTHFEDLAKMEVVACETAARARDSKHQSNHRRTKPATGGQSNVTL